MKPVIIRIADLTGNFAENKDKARDLREEKVMPAISSGTSVILDFDEVDSTTQSFVHALISKVLQDKRENALDLIEFKNCNGPVRSLVSTVVNYSLA